MTATIPASTSMGPVELTVADLARSRAYYEETIGLRALGQDGSTLRLGVEDAELLVLVEVPGARPAVGHTGLFHFALLLPDRPSLARWLAHGAREHVPLAGLSDHSVSEAIYLSDPDQHGIELYADRPRETWEGRVAQDMTTLPLDVDALFAELADPATEPFDGLPAGTTMGHVHLRVANLGDTLSFYRDVLGFELMAEYGGQAVFLAAGGYHHHVGANVWQSAGAPPPPAGTAALRTATVVLPDRAERDALVARVADSGVEPEAVPDGVAVRDPSGNRLLLVARA